jgi:hypothetical protein
VEYHLEEFAGQTRVTHSSDIRFKSFVKIIMFFAGAVFKKKILGQLQREFAQLKRLCEEDVQ